jgi:hypothetical protein
MCADVRLESCGGSVQAKHIQAQNNVLVSFHYIFSYADISIYLSALWSSAASANAS